MNRMRLRIAQRLKSAQNTAAMLTTFNEIDMSGIMKMRKEYKVSLLSDFMRSLSCRICSRRSTILDSASCPLSSRLLPSVSRRNPQSTPSSTTRPTKLSSATTPTSPSPPPLPRVSSFLSSEMSKPCLSST